MCRHASSPARAQSQCVVWYQPLCCGQSPVHCRLPPVGWHMSHVACSMGPTMSGRDTSESLWPRVHEPVADTPGITGPAAGAGFAPTTGSRRMRAKTSPGTTDVAATATPPAPAVVTAAVGAAVPHAVPALSAPPTPSGAPRSGLGCSRCRWGKKGCKTCVALSYQHDGLLSCSSCACDLLALCHPRVAVA